MSGYKRIYPVLMVILAGCGLLSPSSTSLVLTASVVQKTNGYLIELPGSERHPEVEALVTHQRWVIVTIVDPLYDLESLQRFTSAHVDSIEYMRFTSAVQVSLRFRQAVIRASVVSRLTDPGILISVYQP